MKISEVSFNVNFKNWEIDLLKLLLEESEKNDDLILFLDYKDLYDNLNQSYNVSKEDIVDCLIELNETFDIIDINYYNSNGCMALNPSLELHVTNVYENKIKEILNKIYNKRA